MEDVQKIIGAVSLIVATVATIVARFKGTNPRDGVVKRLATTFDLTQILDSTRKLSD